VLLPTVDQLLLAATRAAEHRATDRQLQTHFRWKDPKTAREYVENTMAAKETMALTILGEKKKEPSLFEKVGEKEGMLMIPNATITNFTINNYYGTPKHKQQKENVSPTAKKQKVQRARVLK